MTTSPLHSTEPSPGSTPRAPNPNPNLASRVTDSTRNLSTWNKAHQAVTSSRLLRGVVILAAATLAVSLFLHPPGWVILAMAVSSVVLPILIIKLGKAYMPRADFELTAALNLCRRNYNQILDEDGSPLEIEVPDKEGKLVKKPIQIFIGAAPNQFGTLLEELKKLDKEIAILSFLTKQENQPVGCSLPYTKSDYKHLGIEFHNAEVPDHTQPGFKDLNEAADFIYQQVLAGKTVYIHCRAGVGRSAAAIAAYLIKYHGYTIEEAVAAVQRSRPQATIKKKLPALVAFALANDKCNNLPAHLQKQYERDYKKLCKKPYSKLTPGERLILKTIQKHEKVEGTTAAEDPKAQKEPKLAKVILRGTQLKQSLLDATQSKGSQLGEVHLKQSLLDATRLKESLLGEVFPVAGIVGPKSKENYSLCAGEVLKLIDEIRKAPTSFTLPTIEDRLDYLKNETPNFWKFISKKGATEVQIDKAIQDAKKQWLEEHPEGKELSDSEQLKNAAIHFLETHFDEFVFRETVFGPFHELRIRQMAQGTPSFSTVSGTPGAWEIDDTPADVIFMQIAWALQEMENRPKNPSSLLFTVDEAQILRNADGIVAWAKRTFPHFVLDYLRNGAGRGKTGETLHEELVAGAKKKELFEIETGEVVQIPAGTVVDYDRRPETTIKTKEGEEFSLPNGPEGGKSVLKHFHEIAKNDLSLFETLASLHNQTASLYSVKCMWPKTPSGEVIQFGHILTKPEKAEFEQIDENVFKISYRFWFRFLDPDTKTETHHQDLMAHITLTRSDDMEWLVSEPSLEIKEKKEPEILKWSLEAWCDEKSGDSEHEDRLKAKKKIEECYRDGTTSLDLSGLRLTSLPDSIKFLKHLETLNLAGNLLQNSDASIPDSIKMLESLQTLNLTGNHLTSLQGPIEELKERGVGLTLDGNPLSET